MKFISEFREFALKGNMIDIAVGVVVGTAFNKVVDVLVKDILLPPLLLLTDGMHWDAKRWILREAVEVNGVVTLDEIALGYGRLFEVLVDFFIISVTVFVIVKIMNRLRKKAENVADKSVETPKDIALLHEISALLQAQNALLSKSKQDVPDR